MWPFPRSALFPICFPCHTNTKSYSRAGTERRCTNRARPARLNPRARGTARHRPVVQPCTQRPRIRLAPCCRCIGQLAASRVGAGVRSRRSWCAHHGYINAEPEQGGQGERRGGWEEKRNEDAMGRGDSPWARYYGTVCLPAQLERTACCRQQSDMVAAT